MTTPGAVLSVLVAANTPPASDSLTRLDRKLKADARPTVAQRGYTGRKWRKRRHRAFRGIVGHGR